MSDRLSIIRGVVAQHGRLATDVSHLADGDSLYTAGLSSHASVNVMMALEDEFDVEFPEHLLKRGTFESLHSLESALAEILDTSDLLTA